MCGIIALTPTIWHAISSNVRPISRSDFAGLYAEDYEKNIRESWVWKDLKKVRNARPSFHTKLGKFIFSPFRYMLTILFQVYGQTFLLKSYFQCDE